ncbi:MAG TPA: ATP synthase subunit I [Nitrospirota bacterium]|nr:ATP synthase subunit I [Nitrospirota bacterium]
MLPSNRRHLVRVLIWGGAAALLLAGLSLLKYPPLMAFSIAAGAAISFFNIYSIVMLVESLAGAAASGAGRGAKALTTIAHVIKLALIFAVLLLLVLSRLVNLFGFLAGFTVVLIANLLYGLASFKGDAGKA